ncbi:MAG: hypothetical protein HOP10_03370 [Chitinophagaceae bacterium]|nr:hypothetical protein [Chitinophagaceae bacterium]
MNINRHNYEEYFILYMDNELGSDDRRMVETFVQQHPDLKEELDLLLHYKLEPDTSVVFNDKEELMKVNGETPISLSNYEEWLVLYADNELTPAQKITVEQFTAANPLVKEELALMMRAKLQPDKIVFPYKESLYRKEERRVVPFRWWRVAAAVIIIALGVTSVLVLNKKPAQINKGDVANTNPAIEKQNIPAVNDQPTNTVDPIAAEKISDKPVNQTASANSVKQIPSPAIKQQDKNNIAVKNDKPVINNTPVNNSQPNKKEDIATVDNNKPTNNLPEPLNNPTIRKAVPVDALAGNSSQKNISKELTNNGVTIAPTPPSNTGNPDVIAAGLKETNDLEEGSNNKKSRGLFRKIARTFEKRTNLPATDDNRLLVAGLSFKLK